MNTAFSQGISATEIQLTHGSFGHCLNSTQCFSPKGDWIVYDTRNNDALLAANGEIRVVNTHTGEDKLLYKTAHQTEYGPGVGAATFSPTEDRVLFLGGIQNADKSNPYSFTRRTGISVQSANPQIPIWMDARDIQPPFTAGALRGGTHAHTWSGDGKWISFTYNDHILSEAIKADSSIVDTRTVGIMFPKTVTVPHADCIEQKNGEMYSVLVTRVVKHPTPGSDEISKAFDECWIGSKGYINSDGDIQKRAIAFQGHILDNNGELKTEIFVTDIPDSIDTRSLSGGTTSTLPEVPREIGQRRISFLNKGVSATPRHWLRSTADGSQIGFLMEDENKIIQLFTISPNGGEPQQVTKLKTSISSPFNFSPSGKWAAFIVDGDVCIARLSDGETIVVTKKDEKKGNAVGAVSWSSDGRMICYNRMIPAGDEKFLQIFITSLDGF